jgi:hypothetical protein
VDVILVIGPAPLSAARHATSTIPIVMVRAAPIRFARRRQVTRRPGGNVTA